MSKKISKDNDIRDGKEKQGNLIVRLLNVNGYHNKKNHSDIYLHPKKFTLCSVFIKDNFRTKFECKWFLFKKNRIKKWRNIKWNLKSINNSDTISNKNVIESTMKTLETKKDEKIINIDDNSFDNNL